MGKCWIWIEWLSQILFNVSLVSNDIKGILQTIGYSQTPNREASGRIMYSVIYRSVRLIDTDRASDIGLRYIVLEAMG